MEYTGTPKQILKALIKDFPEIPEISERIDSRIPNRKTKREIYPYQAAALYAAMRPYNRTDAVILEIGTALGYSCSWIAEAAPFAKIITLNPRSDEATIARWNLRYYSNVRVVEAISWEYRPRFTTPLSAVFVDGDHKRVTFDLPYWDQIVPGGLMIFHDYSPEGSGRPCPPVYEALNGFGAEKGLDFGVYVVDNEDVGLVGFYKPSE